MNTLDGQLRSINTSSLFQVNQDGIANNFKTISTVLSSILAELAQKQVQIEELQARVWQQEKDSHKIHDRIELIVIQHNETETYVKELEGRFNIEEHQAIVKEQFETLYSQFDNKLKEQVLLYEHQIQEQKQALQNLQIDYENNCKLQETRQQQNVKQLQERLENYNLNAESNAADVHAVKTQLHELMREVLGYRNKQLCTLKDVQDEVQAKLNEIKLKLNNKFQKIDHHFAKDNRLENVIIPQINLKLHQFEESLYSQFADKLETQKRLNYLQDLIQNYHQELASLQQVEGSFIKRQLNWSCASCDRSLEVSKTQKFSKESPERTKTSKFGIILQSHQRNSSRLTDQKVYRLGGGRPNSPRLLKQSYSLQKELPTVQGKSVSTNHQ